MYERILVPVDADPAGHPAIAKGFQLAQRHDAAITAIHVVQTERIASVPMESAWPGVTSFARQEGEGVIEGVSTLATSVDVPVETVLREGSPSREIVHAAQEHECDLIVMATSGRAGINRILLGSVSECVVRQSPIPVLTVRRQSNHSPEEALADLNAST